MGIVQLIQIHSHSELRTDRVCTDWRAVPAGGLPLSQDIYNEFLREVPRKTHWLEFKGCLGSGPESLLSWSLFSEREDFPGLLQGHSNKILPSQALKGDDGIAGSLSSHPAL